MRGIYQHKAIHVKMDGLPIRVLRRKDGTLGLHWGKVSNKRRRKYHTTSPGSLLFRVRLNRLSSNIKHNRWIKKLSLFISRLSPVASACRRNLTPTAHAPGDDGGTGETPGDSPGDDSGGPGSDSDPAQPPAHCRGLTSPARFPLIPSTRSLRLLARGPMAHALKLDAEGRWAA